MQEKTAGGTPAAPIKLDVSVRVIEPVKNLMGFASVKFNDCFVVENLKIVQGSKGLFLGMPSQPDGKGGYRDTELGPEGVYRYYSTQRPVDIGTYPKLPDNQPLSIVNYDDDRRRPVADGRLMAWGELTYAKPLTEKQMEDYELKPAPGNPDRVRPSITARLKDETRGQEPPKEPGQKRNHKNHEER